MGCEAAVANFGKLRPQALHYTKGFAMLLTRLSARVAISNDQPSFTASAEGLAFRSVHHLLCRLGVPSVCPRPARCRGFVGRPAYLPSMSPDEFSLAFHGWVLRRNVPRVLDLKNVSIAALSTAQQGLRSKFREG
jgi:hypothetical protein